MNGSTARNQHNDAWYRAKQKLNCIDYVRWTTGPGSARIKTPNGKLLNIQLGSMYSPQVNTGIINPTRERLLAFNPHWTDANLDAAIQDLVDSGEWAVEQDATGTITRYVPLFRDELLTVAKDLWKSVKGGKDYAIWVARYSGMTALQRLVLIRALSTITPINNDMGADRTDPRQAKYKSPDGVKYFYSVLFDAPFIRERTDSGYAHIARLDVLPKDIDTRAALIGAQDLTAYTNTDTDTLVRDLFHGPDQDLFDIVDRTDGVLIVPTYTLHQRVWEHQRIPGGGERNAWEVQRGFHPTPDTEIPCSHRPEDADTHRPIVGWHWRYELVVQGDHGEDVVIQVGETTQPLTARLRQHLHTPTNAYAHNRIQAFIAQGNTPRIRVAGIFHHDDIARAETNLMDQRVREGNHINNWILDAHRNKGTIHPHRELTALRHRHGATAFNEALVEARHTYQRLIDADHTTQNWDAHEELREFYENHDPTEDYEYGYA